MTTLSDAIRAVVGGASGNVNDGLKAYFAANGGVGTNLLDLERSFLISQLGLSAPVAATTNDLWRQFLVAFTGSLPDQLLQFWLAGGAVESWTPAEWFLASEQGIWLDQSDFATMFQDAAGTVPVTGAGQPVGRILDKSGRGNHATQATTANKPILQSIGGKLALVFDGVDDYVETGLFPAGTLGNNMDLFALIRLDAVPVDDAYFADFITGVKRYAFALGGIGLLTSQSIAGGFKVNGTTPPQLRQGVFDAMGVGNWCVLEINNIDLSNFVSFGLNNYQTHNSAASFAEVILAPAQSAEARTQAREYLAAKAGITL